ncbi:MAG: orotate phosphoribosyltransferase [Acidimicrobiales bacterium]
MEQYKRDFIDFMIEANVLTFGDFVTKSGRPTPYFVQTGKYRTGSQMRRLGEFYADAILDNFGTDFDVLFGPAYKGIPLAVETAGALSARGHDVGFCFNRKETKDHGEGGVLVGHPLADGDRVLIIEDVTTAGTSIRETVPALEAAADVELAGLVVSVDRMERGTGAKAALAQLADEYGMPTFAIVTVEEVIEHAPIDGATVERMRAYLADFGGH